MQRPVRLAVHWWVRQAARCHGQGHRIGGRKRKRTRTADRQPVLPGATRTIGWDREPRRWHEDLNQRQRARRGPRLGPGPGRRPLDRTRTELLGGLAEHDFERLVVLFLDFVLVIQELRSECLDLPDVFLQMGPQGGTFHPIHIVPFFMEECFRVILHRGASVSSVGRLASPR